MHYILFLLFSYFLLRAIAIVGLDGLEILVVFTYLAIQIGSTVLHTHSVNPAEIFLR